MSAGSDRRSSTRSRTRSTSCCAQDPKLPGVRVRELIEPLGFDGGKTIVDDYLREVRPLFLRPRTLPAHGLSAGGDLPVGSVGALGAGAGRPWPDPSGVWVVVACLGYSRAGAGALIFSQGGARRAVGDGAAACGRWARCRSCWCGTARACLHAGGGRPTEVYAAFCGQLPVDWYFCEPADPQAKGVRRAAAGVHGDELRAGPAFANHLDFQLQLDAWFEKANARTHRTLRGRPVDRLAEEREVMRALPEREPDLDRRWVMRVPPDPHLRFDTNDYSLDPQPRRPPRRGPRLPARDHRGRAGHRRARLPRTSAASRSTARSPRSSTPGRCEQRRGDAERELVVEQRPLAVYDR